MNDGIVSIERRRHSRNLLREMRTRALGWSAAEIKAVIEVLQVVLDAPAPGLETRCDRADQPEAGTSANVSAARQEDFVDVPLNGLGL